MLAAALTIQTVIEAGGFDGVEATEAGLREGVFFDRELLPGGDPAFEDVRAAAVRNLAVQYESDLEHVEHVAMLALQMFDSLVDAGLIDPRPGERELLWAASMLHDVGMTISYDDHHKHSRYLIVSAELPGFDPRERALIAQISRYHRKGAPKLGVMSSLSLPGDEELRGPLLGAAEARRAPRARARPVGPRGTAARKRRRRRPPPRRLRREPGAAPLERRALRRRRGVRARIRPPVC